MKRRVVVTGLGVVTSLGCQLDSVWDRVVAGESGIHELKLVDTTNFKVRIAGDVYDWQPDAYLSPKDVKRVDRFTQFGWAAALEAVKDSGLDFSNENPTRCGVILGSGIGGLGEIETQMVRLMSKGPDRVSPMTVPRMMGNAAGANIGIDLGLRGPNYCVTTACASATNAMGDAFRTIREGWSDVIVTGGTEAAICGMSLAAFQNIKALSMRNDEPAKASRPFDSERDGFVFSEGAGLLIFEEYERAKQRGAKIYCEVLGYGTSCDAIHITHPDEQGEGAALAMSLAVEDAGLPADQIDYINAHGTSTQLGDIAETIAIKKVLGDHASKVSISSTKSQLGHSLGASGGIELVLSIKALERNVVPPTINLEYPDPECDLDYTPNEARERELHVVMSNSFGFGGHNASIIVGKQKD